MTTVPLRKLVNDEQWEAEELSGRLGVLAHAALRRNGFIPYGDELSSGHLLKQVEEIGPSALCLFRRYTAPQLVRREGGAAVDVAVLEVRARGSGEVEFQAYILTRDGERRCGCEAVLDEVVLAPLLNSRVADAVRALEAEEPADASLWRLLEDRVFPILFLDLCRRNDLPLTSITSLPDDLTADILKRLTDGKDLARVECTSKQLQHLVTDRELWKAIYESRSLLPELQRSNFESEALGSWKERYMKAKRPQRRSIRDYFHGDIDIEWFTPNFCQLEAQSYHFFRSYHDGAGFLAPRSHEQEVQWQNVLRAFADDGDWRRSREQEVELQNAFRVFDEDADWRRRPQQEADLQSFWKFDFLLPTEDHFYPPAPAPEREVAARGKNTGRQHRKVLRKNEYPRKRHGGVIHSPSSRYKWNHR